MAALLEQGLGMGLLEKAGTNSLRRDMRRNAEHRDPRAVAVEQAVDEMQVAGSATASADREFDGWSSLTPRGRTFRMCRIGGRF
jgi:hypothetical protein